RCARRVDRQCASTNLRPRATGNWTARAVRFGAVLVRTDAELPSMSMSSDLEYPTARAFLPARTSLSSLREAARRCRGCPLYAHATQTVFGEGRRSARVVLVGEQPGNEEDVRGKPFVGPAGALLDDALAVAGIARTDVYVTNVVKHFKWIPSGKRRLHKR